MIFRIKPTIVFIAFYYFFTNTSSAFSTPPQNLSSKEENLLLVDYMKKQVLSANEINTVLSLLTKTKKTNDINTSELKEQIRMKEIKKLVHQFKMIKIRFNKKQKLGKQVITAIESGELDTAEELLKKATTNIELMKQNKKDNIRNIFALAGISELKKNNKKTILYYERINKLAPENTTAWYVTAKKLSDLGQHKKAIIAWQNMQLNAEKIDDTYSIADGLKGEIDSIIELGESEDLVFKKYEKLKEIVLYNRQKIKSLTSPSN
jgi:tetratricopeptide (TPR) repeat protein